MDLPKIVMDENYMVLEKVGGSVDMPRNTKMHFCVDTEKLAEASSQWEVERKALMNSDLKIAGTTDYRLSARIPNGTH